MTFSRRAAGLGKAKSPQNSRIFSKLGLLTFYCRKLQENEVREAASVLFTRNGFQNETELRSPLQSTTSSLESTPRNSPRSNNDSRIASRHAINKRDVANENQQSNSDSTFRSKLQPAKKENLTLSHSENQDINSKIANRRYDKAKRSSNVLKRSDIALMNVENEDNGSIDLPITPASDETNVVNDKLREAERIISQLQEENLRQRKEVCT